MIISLADYLVWWLSFALQIAIASLVLKHGLLRRYRVVFLYLAFWILANPLLFIIHSHYAAYFYAYWIAQVVSYILQLQIAALLFRSVSPGVSPAVTRAFIVLMSLVTGVIIFMGHNEPVGLLSQSVAFLGRTQDALYFIRASIFVLIMIYAAPAGLTRSSRNVRLAAGYGLYAGAALLMVGLEQQAPGLDHRIISLTRNWAYAASLLMWLHAFLPPPMSEEQRTKALNVIKQGLECHLQAIERKEPPR